MSPFGHVYTDLSYVRPLFLSFGDMFQLKVLIIRLLHGPSYQTRQLGLAFTGQGKIKKNRKNYHLTHARNTNKVCCM